MMLADTSIYTSKLFNYNLKQYNLSRLLALSLQPVSHADKIINICTIELRL